ncbi:transporter [Novilysobacter erysipheiresistens]|uniref:Transporter n=1 Tax=Novilysobacter erysipheiresistens TaxID=1749332 RepID=A0ABU7YXY8_9GAMM
MMGTPGTTRLTANLLGLAIAAALTGTAHAADPLATGSMQDDGEASLREQLQQFGETLAAQQREIQRLRDEVERLEMAQRGRGLGPAPQEQSPQELSPQEPPPTQLAQQAPQAPQPIPPPAPADEPMQIGEARREAEAAQREQEKALVVREHAPLFERKFTFDAGMNYSYYDRRQLALSGFLALDAIFLGNLNLDQSKVTVATLDVTGRYGLTDRISLEASIPYVWRDSRFVSAGVGGASTAVSEVQLSSSGIGDASVAAYYQLVKESARWPDLVASLRVRAPTGRDPFGLKLIQADETNDNLNVPEALPTGTGLWSATANVSALRTYDPVILFANVGYTMYRPEDFDDISPVLDQVSPAEVSLGNSIQLSAGLAIALNDRSAVSFSVASAFSAATHTTAPGQAEMRVPGSSSNSTALNIGATYALPSGWTMSGQLAAGLTPDAPNFVMGIRASKSF